MTYAEREQAIANGREAELNNYLTDKTPPEQTCEYCGWAMSQCECDYCKDCGENKKECKCK